MSLLIENADLHQKFGVTVVMQVAQPTSFDPKAPLIPTSLINDQHPIALPEKSDKISGIDLDELRQAWLNALDRKTISLEERAVAPEEILNKLIRDAAAKDEKDSLRSAIENSELPIPYDYTIAVPMMDITDRKDLIASLVPFEETRGMLLRLEDTLELPMRTIRLISRIDDTPELITL